jgi:putative oxidoreductase
MNKYDLMRTDADKTTILIRFLVGVVFLSEGIQKFLYAEYLGAGRFAGIGIPYPEIMGPFVGVVEIVCGAMVLAGFYTRLAAIPLIITMLVALFTTKIPILLGTEFMGFALRPLRNYGLLSMLHESRNDLAMLIGSIFLLIKGGGPWSIDRKRYRR